MKKFIILFIIVLVAVLVWWSLSSNNAVAPTANTDQNGNEVASTDEFQSLDASFDTEFEDVDNDSSKL